MIKLEKIIAQLNDAVYEKLENALVKTRGDNFLYLLQAYRNKNVNDEKVQHHLKLSPNSFYVLKSRLYDKIQEQLSGDIHSNREEITRQLHKVPEMCFSTSREVATAFLLKLEKDLLHHDMHNELLVVYSALKQIHLFSDKYFHYSQLYNKHIAFSLSIEKSTEMLGNFNRVLGQYHFTRESRHLETLVFIRRGINDHFTLQPSRQIEIIRNIIDIQLELFCGMVHTELSGLELLHQTTHLISDLPASSQLKIWINSLDFLYFEYYSRMGQKKAAAEYFSKVNARLGTILLYTNICVTAYFLESRIAYLQAEKKTSMIHRLNDDQVLYDSEDVHTIILLEIHNSFASYYAGNTKEATAQLNQLLNDRSFKDLMHITTEIKLCLVFFYLQLKDYVVASNILKNLQRKLKSENPDEHTGAFYLIKLFNGIIKDPAAFPTRKQEELLELFLANNKSNRKNSTLP